MIREDMAIVTARGCGLLFDLLSDVKAALEIQNLLIAAKLFLSDELVASILKTIE